MEQEKLFNQLEPKHLPREDGYFRQHDSEKLSCQRQVLEKWFVNVKNPRARKSIRSRINDRKPSKQINQFYSAFWELYLHQLFLRLGCKVEPEKELPKSSADQSSTPDLFIQYHHLSFYVEATVIGPPDREAKEDWRHNMVANALRPLNTGPVSLDLEYVCAPPKASHPSFKKLLDEVAVWIKDLQQDEDFISTGSLISREFAPNQEWKIKLSAQYYPDCRQQGIRFFPLQEISSQRFKETIDKAIGAVENKYSQHKKKLGESKIVIAILLQDPISGEDEVNQIKECLEAKVRSKPTVFSRDCLAVLVAQNLSLDNLESVKPSVWKNPLQSETKFSFSNENLTDLVI